MILSIFASVIFRGFWNFEFDDVIAAILHLRVAALSRSQFWSDFLQNLGQGTIKSCIVWYWKSARSINNFRSKKQTAFESHRCFGFRAELWGRGFESQRGQIFLFVIMNVFSFEISQNRLNDWIYYNTLVFLFLCYHGVVSHEQIAGDSNTNRNRFARIGCGIYLNCWGSEKEMKNHKCSYKFINNFVFMKLWYFIVCVQSYIS